MRCSSAIRRTTTEDFDEPTTATRQELPRRRGRLSGARSTFGVHAGVNRQAFRASCSCTATHVSAASQRPGDGARVAWTGQNVTLALPTVRAKLPTVAATMAP